MLPDRLTKRLGHGVAELNRTFKRPFDAISAPRVS